jgi:hypothetical protein
MMETMAIAGSIIASCMAITAMLLARRPAPAGNRTLTITIEDSSGARTRIVAESSRSLDEVMRLLEGVIAQPS